MKYLLITSFLLIGCRTAYSQDFQFDDIIGTYEGTSLHNKESSYQLNINSNKRFVFSLKSNGLWLGMIEGDLEKKNFFATKDGGVTYEFNIKNSSEGYNDLVIAILSEASKSKLNINGVFIFLNKDGEVPFNLDMNRQGGNPEIKLPAKTKNYFATGSLTAWGNYKVEFSPKQQKGAFVYDNIYNLFLFTKEGDKYIVKDEAGKKFRLEYYHNMTTQTLQLTSKPIDNKHYFDEKVLIQQIETGRTVQDETALLKGLVEMTYEVFKPVYKPNNTDDFYASANGDSCHCIIFQNSGVTFIGEVLNGVIEGEGVEITKDEVRKGSWVFSHKDGKFEIETSTGTSTGFYKIGFKEGIWLTQSKDGTTSQIRYDKGKKVVEKTINNGKNVKIGETPLMLNELIIATQNEATELKSFHDKFFTFYMENKYEKLSLSEIKSNLETMTTALKVIQTNHNNLTTKIDQLIKAAENGNCSDSVEKYKKVQSSNARLLKAVNSSLVKINRAANLNSKSDIRSIVFDEVCINVSMYGSTFSEAVKTAEQTRCNYLFD